MGGKRNAAHRDDKNNQGRIIFFENLSDFLIGFDSGKISQGVLNPGGLILSSLDQLMARRFFSSIAL